MNVNTEVKIDNIFMDVGLITCSSLSLKYSRVNICTYIYYIRTVSHLLVWHKFDASDI